MAAKHAFLLAVTLAAGFRLEAAGPTAFALTNARIVRVSGPTIERGVVVLRDGFIDAVGENVTPPPDAWVIDCKGLTVYPGLIDALSTWGVPRNAGGRGGAAPTQPGAPVRGPEDRPSNASWTKIADQIVPTDASIQTARDGGFTTAVTFPTGNIFAGQGSAFDLAGDRAGSMVLADSVGQLISLRPGGGGRGGFPSSLMGSISYVRQTYLDAEHYRNAKATYDKQPSAALRRPAYDRAIEGVLASPLALLPAERATEMERMLALIKELNLKAVLYGGQEAWRVTSALKQANVPVLLSLKYPEKPRDADPSVDEPARVLEFREKAPSTAGALAKAGVQFAFYSDGIATPREIMRAVKSAIDAGLSSDDAVRALTLTPAGIYGLASRIGSIDKGKIANIVVTEGDIFATNTKVKYVFVDGEKFEPRPVEPAGRGGRGPAQ